jgi:lysophospholipase L1-like esterase
MYVYNEAAGLLLLRPSAVIEGSKARIVSNSLGLRSPEISVTPVDGVYRIAVVGASTVMGAFAARNEDTFPYLLKDALIERNPGSRFEVVNAGIPGYSLSKQRKLVENVIAGLHPHLIILYPGFIDISGYCKETTSELAGTPVARPLPQLKMPQWLSSIDLLLKNTVVLRDAPAKQPNQKTLDDIDTQSYDEDLDKLLQAIQGRDIDLLVMTVARAYRRDMPESEQMHLSQMARYYNECFDLTALHDVADFHNQIIAEQAQSRDAPVFRTDRIIPGGAEYFGDANHFSPRGEQSVADALANFVFESGLIR